MVQAAWTIPRAQIVMCSTAIIPSILLPDGPVNREWLEIKIIFRALLGIFSLCRTFMVYIKQCYKKQWQNIVLLEINKEGIRDSAYN